MTINCGKTHLRLTPELLYVANATHLLFLTRVCCVSLCSYFQVSHKVKPTLGPLTTSSSHPTSVFNRSHVWPMFGEVVTTHEFRCKPYFTLGSGASCLTWYLLTPLHIMTRVSLSAAAECSHPTSHHVDTIKKF